MSEQQQAEQALKRAIRDLGRSLDEAWEGRPKGPKAHDVRSHIIAVDRAADAYIEMMDRRGDDASA